MAKVTAHLTGDRVAIACVGDTARFDDSGQDVARDDRRIIRTRNGHDDFVYGAIRRLHRKGVCQRVRRAAKCLNVGVALIGRVGPSPVRADGQRAIGASNRSCLPKIILIVDVGMVDIARNRRRDVCAVQHPACFANRACGPGRNRSVIGPVDGDRNLLGRAVFSVHRDRFDQGRRGRIQRLNSTVGVVQRIGPFPGSIDDK